MKGVIFVKLSEFIESTFGEAFWDELLTQANLPSHGAYTTVSTYDDNELFQLIALIESQKGVSAAEAQRAFGSWLFRHLIELAPEHKGTIISTFDFLEKVQNMVHVEVKKLHPDALLPQFTFLQTSPNHLALRYESERGLCFLCEGLIQGLAQFTQENIQVQQSQCIHVGDSDCIIEVQKNHD